MKSSIEPLKGVARKFLDLLKLPPKLTVSEWSDRYRYLSSEASSKGGKWHTLPMQREPMDAVSDPEVESVVLQWASQTAGKTELILNIIGYFIDQDPSPMLALQPTVDLGETFSKDRVAPMVRDTPRLHGRIRDPRSRDSGNTILHKVFPGGHLTMVGANAPGNLAMRPVRVVICDEVDRYPISAGTEGDPISLAEKRTDTFWDAVLFKTSTPTVKGRSRIEKEFKQTDQRYWFCPCPKCGEYQTLKWAQVRWDKDKPETARYQCEKCDTRINDKQRRAMIAAGEWRPTAKFNGKRGYHLSGIYSLFRRKKGYKNRLHQMAAQFLEAKSKGAETLRVWINTFLAETYEEESEKVDHAPILERVEKYGPALPEGVLLLTAGIDVQSSKHRDAKLEAEIVGWGVGEESWGIRVGRFDGDLELPGIWTELGNFLDQRFSHPGGTTLKVVRAFIDSGHKPKYVKAFAKQMRGIVIPIKGSSDALHPIAKPSKAVGGYMVGTVTLKDHIYSRLALTDKGPRFMHFPVGYGYTEQWFQQLTSNRRMSRYERGRLVHAYEKESQGVRDEALDMRVYAFGAMDTLNPDWEALTKMLASQPKMGDKAHGSRGQRAGVGGWVNGWRK